MAKPAVTWLDPKSVSVALVAVTLLIDVGGYLWHGFLGQPSIINVVYPGFWSDWTLMASALACTVLVAYVSGYVFAWVYNWALKKL